MSAYRALANKMRAVAAEVSLKVSPPIERFRVTKLEPLTLEAFGSEQELVDGQDDLDVSPGIRNRAELNDTVLVSMDAHGDRYVHGLTRTRQEEAENPTQHSGNGSPEGRVAARPGSFYQRLDGGAGTCFYVKETGTGKTGWEPK